MNTAEAAVAENANHVAAHGLLANVLDDRINIRQISAIFSASADLPHEAFRIKPFGGWNLPATVATLLCTSAIPRVFHRIMKSHGMNATQASAESRAGGKESP